MVECFLAKEDVAGSTPVSRSKTSSFYTYGSQGSTLHRTKTVCPAHRRACCVGLAGSPEARYPSGKGEVCKTFMRRFDPDPRLQKFQ